MLEKGETGNGRPYSVLFQRLPPLTESSYSHFLSRFLSVRLRLTVRPTDQCRPPPGVFFFFQDRPFSIHPGVLRKRLSSRKRRRRRAWIADRAFPSPFECPFPACRFPISGGPPKKATTTTNCHGYFPPPRRPKSITLTSFFPTRGHANVFC